MPTISRSYGWVPDIPDQRDHLYTAPPVVLEALPDRTDIRAMCPDIYDQGQLGSCTANAIAGAFACGQRLQQLTEFTPSRLFIYYNERAMEGTIRTDAGASLRDGVKTVASQGVCPETLWPYDVTQFAVRPAASVYRAARDHKALSYQRVQQSLSQLKGCLAHGYPFVFGFAVYESFESPAVASTGVVSMPRGRECMLGGHAVMAVGYDDASQRFIVRNSWGASWGDEGYCTMPYAYLASASLSADFWALLQVS